MMNQFGQDGSFFIFSVKRSHQNPVQWIFPSASETKFPVFSENFFAFGTNLVGENFYFFEAFRTDPKIILVANDATDREKNIQNNFLEIFFGHFFKFKPAKNLSQDNFFVFYLQTQSFCGSIFKR